MDLVGLRQYHTFGLKLLKIETNPARGDIFIVKYRYERTPNPEGVTLSYGKHQDMEHNEPLRTKLWTS
jgi:hypothetical protein